MTVGEHGGRDYGRDDQSDSPYYPATGASWEQDGAGDGGWAGAGGAGSTGSWSAEDYRGGYGTAPRHGSQAAGYQASGYESGGYEASGYEPGDYRTGGYDANSYEGGRHATGEYRSAGQPANGYPAEGYRPEGAGARDGDAYGQRDGDVAYGQFGYGTGGYPDSGRRGGDYADSRRRPSDAWESRRGGSSPRRAAGVERDGPDDDPGIGRRSGRRKGLPLWQELPLLLIIAFCLAVLIRTFLMQAFYIPSGSMEDTLVAGDRVLVNKLVYDFRDPVRGEVVVFRGTAAWAPATDLDDDIGIFARVGRTLGDLVGISRPGEKDYIKRIIGLPGDRVSCCDVEGRVYVNGQPIEEDYVIRDSPLDVPPALDCRGRRFDEVVVEPGNMFVMGDHRLVSQDSRCQGQVPVENIIGRAFVIVWPNDRWAGLSAPDTFDNVPPPTGTAIATTSIPAGYNQLPLVLPVLVPLPLTFRSITARSRLIGLCRGRRLSG